MQEMLILVNEQDEPMGFMEKMRVHQEGLLHRAFSGFIFNAQGELLLQQRSLGKYHNPGIWSNTVCSHPHPAEDILTAVQRRIREEFGFNSEFTEVGKFIYRQQFDNGLIEYELDHLCVATYQGQTIQPAATEIADYTWMSRPQLTQAITKAPNQYSIWLQQILQLPLLTPYF